MCDDGGSSEADSEEMMFAVTDVRQVRLLNLKFSSNIPMDGSIWEASKSRGQPYPKVLGAAPHECKRVVMKISSGISV